MLKWQEEYIHGTYYLLIQRACATCITFGKESLILEKCASEGCQGYARDVLNNGKKVVESASKYCSEECGKSTNLRILKIIKSTQVKPVKYFKTHIKEKYLQDKEPYSYDELKDEMVKLQNEKNNLKQEIQKYERKLLEIDEIVDFIYNSNLNKATVDMVCGFDYRILQCDLDILESRIEIPQFMNQVHDASDAVKVEKDINSIPEKTENTHDIQIKNETIDLQDSVHSVDYSKVCETVGKCWKHSGWQKLKTIEIEIQLEELVRINLLNV